MIDWLEAWLDWRLGLIGLAWLSWLGAQQVKGGLWEYAFLQVCLASGPPPGFCSWVTNPSVIGQAEGNQTIPYIKAYTRVPIFLSATEFAPRYAHSHICMHISPKGIALTWAWELPKRRHTDLAWSLPCQRVWLHCGAPIIHACMHTTTLGGNTLSCAR